jgi:hypothetical protein
VNFSNAMQEHHPLWMRAGVAYTPSPKPFEFFSRNGARQESARQIRSTTIIDFQVLDYENAKIGPAEFLDHTDSSYQNLKQSHRYSQRGGTIFHG